MIDSVIKTYKYSGEGFDIASIFADQPHLFFLQSSQYDLHRGRYSFIGFSPFDIYQSRQSDALIQLEEKFSPYRSNVKNEFTPLVAGIVGFLGYDHGVCQERMTLSSRNDLNLPHCFFGFYDSIITIDHFTQNLYVCALTTKRALEQFKKTTVKISKEIADLPKTDSILKNGSPVTIKCNFTKAQYFQAVEKALDYIRRGDIYQVNLSQRFEFNYSESFDPLHIYRVLTTLSPSAFGGYFDCGHFQIISSSPERFLYLQDNILQTRPMKGTRPRGKTIQEDQAFKYEMMHDEKEKAELLMITDLERNDLGKVCEYGSVCVKEMRTIEEYHTVFQATSTVEGKLKKGYSEFDVLKACFPSGSITGCPKIRSMEIIEELEPHRRGVYTGTMGYISFSGGMDFNILIRTLLTHRGKIYFHVGAGIVADSTPEKEYNETLVKAEAIRTCLESLSLESVSLQNF